MIVERVHVRNFRSIWDASITCEHLTALVGRNGAGKSSFLHALELFYDAGAKVSPKDFYDEDTTQDIEIAVTFHNLTAEEAASFESYVQDGRLEVVRVVSHDAGTRSGLYHGMQLQNPEFEPVRAQCEGRGGGRLADPTHAATDDDLGHATSRSASISVLAIVSRSWDVGGAGVRGRWARGMPARSPSSRSESAWDSRDCRAARRSAAASRGARLGRVARCGRTFSQVWGRGCATT